MSELPRPDSAGRPENRTKTVSTPSLRTPPPSPKRPPSGKGLQPQPKAKPPPRKTSRPCRLPQKAEEKGARSRRAKSPTQYPNRPFREKPDGPGLPRGAKSTPNKACAKLAQGQQGQVPHDAKSAWNTNASTTTMWGLPGEEKLVHRNGLKTPQTPTDVQLRHKPYESPTSAAEILPKGILDLQEDSRPPKLALTVRLREGKWHTAISILESAKTV